MAEGGLRNELLKSVLNNSLSFLSFTMNPKLVIIGFSWFVYLRFLCAGHIGACSGSLWTCGRTMCSFSRCFISFEASNLTFTMSNTRSCNPILTSPNTTCLTSVKLKPACSDGPNDEEVGAQNCHFMLGHSPELSHRLKKKDKRKERGAYE